MSTDQVFCIDSDITLRYKETRRRRQEGSSERDRVPGHADGSNTASSGRSKLNGSMDTVRQRKSWIHPSTHKQPCAAHHNWTHVCVCNPVQIMLSCFQTGDAIILSPHGEGCCIFRKTCLCSCYIGEAFRGRGPLSLWFGVYWSVLCRKTHFDAEHYAVSWG